MIAADYAILMVMGGSAAIAAGSFFVIAGYLFGHGLADRNEPVPDILGLYKTYLRDTKAKTGRIGAAFWVHSASAAIFIFTGVVYTIVRFVLPRFF